MDNNSQLPEASSDDKEDNSPLPLHSKRRRAQLMSTISMPLVAYNLSTEKRQRWVCEPAVDNSSRYWDAPVARTEINLIISDVEVNKGLAAKGIRCRVI